jgi:hypothetical protein
MSAARSYNLIVSKIFLSPSQAVRHKAETSEVSSTFMEHSKYLNFEN